MLVCETSILRPAVAPSNQVLRVKNEAIERMRSENERLQRELTGTQSRLQMRRMEACTHRPATRCHLPRLRCRRPITQSTRRRRRLGPRARRARCVKSCMPCRTSSLAGVPHRARVAASWPALKAAEATTNMSRSQVPDMRGARSAEEATREGGARTQDGSCAWAARQRSSWAPARTECVGWLVASVAVTPRCYCHCRMLVCMSSWVDSRC